MILFLVAAGCKDWNGQDNAMLKAHASTDTSDVCLTHIFTAQSFGSTLGNISQSQSSLLRWDHPRDCLLSDLFRREESRDDVHDSF